MKDICVYYPAVKKAMMFIDNTQDWKRGYIRKIKPGSTAVVQETKKVKDAITSGKLQMIKNINVGKQTVQESKPYRKIQTENGIGIYIPGEVISSKNSKRAFGTKNRDGKVKAWVTRSEASLDYEKETEKRYQSARLDFQELIKNFNPPYLIQFKFYRSTFTDFDFANMVQVVQDMMVKSDWIEDDNCRVMLPIPDMSGPWEKREQSPGVLISVYTSMNNPKHADLQTWSNNIISLKKKK